MPKHLKTLAGIREVAANLKWQDIESLLRSLGAVVEEREGSRVCVKLDDNVAVFHRPHPSPEAKRSTVRSVKKFLEKAGRL